MERERLKRVEKSSTTESAIIFLNRSVMSTFFELAPPPASPLASIGNTLEDLETLDDAEAFTQHGLAESVSAREIRKFWRDDDASSLRAGPVEEAMMEKDGSLYMYQHLNSQVLHMIVKKSVDVF